MKKKPRRLTDRPPEHTGLQQLGRAGSPSLSALSDSSAGEGSRLTRPIGRAYLSTVSLSLNQEAFHPQAKNGPCLQVSRKERSVGFTPRCHCLNRILGSSLDFAKGPLGVFSTNYAPGNGWEIEGREEHLNLM